MKKMKFWVNFLIKLVNKKEHEDKESPISKHSNDSLEIKQTTSDKDVNAENSENLFNKMTIQK